MKKPSATLSFSQSYSPDLNKIDPRWALLKQGIRTNSHPELPFPEKLNQQLIPMNLNLNDYKCKDTKSVVEFEKFGLSGWLVLMPDTFISYSRRNKTFVRKIVDALRNQGKEPWLDEVKEPLQGIPPGSRWWDEIKYAIENTDNFLFVISPESIASPYCQAEIAHARKHDKRIVTLLHCDHYSEIETLQAVDAAIEAVPKGEQLPDTVTIDTNDLRTLVRHNWLALIGVQYVAFSENTLFDTSLKQLLLALNLDLAWVRMRSQIRQATQLWEDNAFSDAYRWPAERLKPVQEMIARVQPDLSELEQNFIEPELDRLLDELENLDIPHFRRNWIGERLCIIGDTRKGVGLQEDGLPDIDWCVVNPSNIQQNLIPPKSSGSAEVEIFGKQRVDLPFYISKYLITYQQFQAFIDATDGHNSSVHDWYEGLGASEDDKKLHEQRFKLPNNPRENVNWYQAMAFCSWLSWRLLQLKRAQSSIDATQPFIWAVRLPTEAEWQFAATNGEIGNIYPWGKEWDERRANTANTELQRTTAVGMYPGGNAPCGALDFSGNVKEWTLTAYQQAKAFVYTRGINLHNQRAVRGGSYYTGQHDADSTFHYTLPADYYMDFLGFRIVSPFKVKGT